MELTILNRHVLIDIPSASGIELINGEIYVIGDNTPWLFKLNKQFRVKDKFQIAAFDVLTGNEIAKKTKPDFEALTAIGSGGNQELLIFGSGSKSQHRNVLVRTNLKDPTNSKTYSVEKFYRMIREVSEVKKKELNIEAAVADSETLYLFNRGKNILFKFNLNNFLEHITLQADCPVPEIFHFKLPEINGIKAGFSGATIIPGTKKIIFTASVENTSNWIDDGELHGSFIGLIDSDTIASNSTPACIPLMTKGQIMKKKVESVAVHHIDSETMLHLLLITDNDGKTSELFEATLKV